jgi:hypothetical protein
MRIGQGNAQIAKILPRRRQIHNVVRAERARSAAKAIYRF